MKRLQAELIGSGLVILNGVLLLLCPLFHWIQFDFFFSGSILFYAVIHVVLYLVNKRDYIHALMALASLFIGIGSIFFHVTNTPRYLAITLLVWLMLLALIKLKKADLYHDRKSKLWTFEVLGLILFGAAGILTSINFLYGIETHLLVFGYFLFILGIFDFITPFVTYMMKGKIK